MKKTDKTKLLDEVERRAKVGVKKERSKKKRVKRPTYKPREFETTVAAAIGDAFAEFTTLHEEMEEGRDNMDGANMSHLPKYETYDNAVSELENHNNEPDVPECIAELKVTATEMVNSNKRRGTSRSMRLSNAQALILAAKTTLEEYAGSDDPERKDEDAEAADQLVNDLDEHCDFDVEFPGMFG